MRRKIDRAEICSCNVVFYFNNPNFIETLKKYYPDVYTALVKTMKENGKPEQCLMCEAYYWDGKAPACSIGGTITELDRSVNCPLEKDS